MGGGEDSHAYFDTAVTLVNCYNQRLEMTTTAKKKNREK